MLILNKIKVALSVITGRFVVGIIYTNEGAVKHFMLGDVDGEANVVMSYGLSQTAHHLKQEYIDLIVNKGHAREASRMRKLWEKGIADAKDLSKSIEDLIETSRIFSEFENKNE